MQLFGEVGLFCAEAGFSIDRGPRRSRVPAAHELLVDLFVAGAAVGGRNVRRDDKAVVILTISFLSFLGLMAIEAVDALRGVLAHFIFVDDGILLAGVAFGAFACSL